MNEKQLKEDTPEMKDSAGNAISGEQLVEDVCCRFQGVQVETWWGG